MPGGKCVPLKLQRDKRRRGGGWRRVDGVGPSGRESRDHSGEKEPRFTRVATPENEVSHFHM